MRIHKIRFENIHSLRGEHEIDFATGILADAGLFAITGPTGSGKSTLLDVITLALFNKIARIHSNVSNTILDEDGGVMTRNTQSCYAEVEYSCKGKLYRSHWSISRNRRNNLSPRKQELVVLETGEILESGTKTPNKNEEIIGLTYEQFIKAIVLAQGEFSKLLQASRKDRNRLLEDLTGARHFRQIGIAVYERQWKIKNEIDLKNASLEGIHLLSEEEVTQKTTAFQTLTEKRPRLAKEADMARKKVEVRVELVAKQKDKTRLESAKAEHQKKVGEYLPYKNQLAIHERLVKHLDVLRSYDGLLENASKLRENEDGLKKEYVQTETLQERWLQAASELLKKPVTVEQVVRELESFRETIEKLVAEEKMKFQEAAMYANQVATLSKTLTEKGYPLPDREREEFVSELQFLHHRVTQYLTESGVASLEEATEGIQAQRQLQEYGMQVLNKKEAYTKAEVALEKTRKQFGENQEKITENSKEKADAEKRLQVLSEEVLQLEKEIEHQRLHQSLETHRQHLKDDEPCPLCGALEHPYASETVVVDIQDELLVEKKNSQTKETRLIASLESSNEVLKRENARLQTDEATGNEELKQLQEQLEDIASKLAWNWKAPLEALQNHHKTISDRIHRLEKSRQAIEIKGLIENITAQHQLWQEKMAAYDSVKADRMKLYDGTAIGSEVSELSHKINRNSAQLEALKKQLQQNTDQQQSLRGQLENEKLTLSTILSQEKLPSLEALRRGIMKEDRAKKIRDREGVLNKEHTQLQEQEKHLLARIDELQKEDDATVELEQLQTHAARMKKESEETQVQIGRLSQELEQNEAAKKRQESVLITLKALEKDFALWKKMSDLIGDRKGNKFSHFVQDLTLKQLIGYTNTRLKEFSDRYVLDVKSAEEKTDTLYVLDTYMGNSRRSVKTLSGGETFLVSLAMAFALSDIAARHVKIESLFIDEGFGTLDPETLDQAITVLEKMQNESNRSIGIISHVDELKKRIAAQICLEKQSLGNSVLEVRQVF